MIDTEVIYKCACSPAEVMVMVPARRPDEDLREWMELCMGPSLYLHHRRASPACRAKASEYVKVPANYETGRAGEPPTAH